MPLHRSHDPNSRGRLQLRQDATGEAVAQPYYIHDTNTPKRFSASVLKASQYDQSGMNTDADLFHAHTKIHKLKVAPWRHVKVIIDPERQFTSGPNQFPHDD